ncbi:MAG: glycosyltransferase [Bacillota bacterium]|jgi:glycosyltransferase involved in cell wall biosynthesis|nr:glycosyltransferase [Bacillota bacterium]
MDVIKRKTIIFACSLTSKKHHFDGERRKSSDILDVLKKRYNVKVCNFTKNKYLQLIKFIFLVFFNRKRFVFIAKAPTGGNLLLKILRSIKYPQSLIAFYLYGKGLLGGYFESRVNIINLKYPDCLICESNFIKNDFIKRGFDEKKIKIFPCLKKKYNIDIPQYKKKDIILGVFISRIVEAKGVLDLIKALNIVNKNQTKYKVTISGGWPEIETEKKIIEEAKRRNDIEYLGQSFSLSEQKDYEFLSSFDIHFFPTKFPHEGIPGVAIDAFVAGLPTLTSSYDCANEVFSDETAFFFKYADLNDLVLKMNYLYENQEELYSKRANCLKEAKKYSEESFDIFISKIIG